MRKLKVIIVDDERLARAEMKRSIAHYSELEVVGEAANADEAEKLIKICPPDLILLDIQMPVRSGFDLLEALAHVPEVIFTTAFDAYAVKAFELSALDYLVKPIREERLTKAVTKFLAKVTPENRELKSNSLFVKEGEKYHFIQLSSIFYIESIGNYARIYFKDQKVYLKRSLNQLEKTLDPASFFRINRTTLINTNYIKQVQTLPKGQLILSLTNGESFTASSRQSVAFKNRNLL